MKIYVGMRVNLGTILMWTVAIGGLLLLALIGK